MDKTIRAKFIKVLAGKNKDNMPNIYAYIDDLAKRPSEVKKIYVKTGTDLRQSLESKFMRFNHGKAALVERKPYIEDHVPVRGRAPPEDGEEEDDEDEWADVGKSKRTSKTNKKDATLAENEPTQGTHKPPGQLKKRDNQGAGGPRAEWGDLRPRSDTRFVNTDQEDAPKCSLESEAQDACGYVLCTSKQAAKAVNQWATKLVHLVAFVIPYEGEGKFRQICDVINNLNKREDTSFAVTRADFIATDDVKGEDELCEAVIVNAFRSFSIHPTSTVNISANIALNSFAVAQEVRVFVTMQKPMMEELGQLEWWNDFKSKPREKQQADIVKILGRSNIKGTPFISNDFDLNWKSTTMKDARVHASAKVPCDKVDEVLRQSGQMGIVTEVPKKEMPNRTMVRENIPFAWSLQETLNRVQNLPNDVRSKVYGIVPSFKHYKVRMLEEDRAEVLTALLLDKAKQLGAALGMVLSKCEKYEVAGVPYHVDMENLGATLANRTYTWRGWTVTPSHRIPRKGTSRATWLVYADRPPPSLSMFTSTGTVAIRKHQEMTQLSRKNADWGKVDNPKAAANAQKEKGNKEASTSIDTAGIAAGFWARDADFTEHNEEEEDTFDDLDVDTEENVLETSAAVPTPRPKAAAMPVVRMAPVTTHQHFNISDGEMQPQVDVRDGLIAELRATIESLKDQLRETQRQQAEQFSTFMAQLAKLQENAGAKRKKKNDSRGITTHEDTDE